MRPRGLGGGAAGQVQGQDAPHRHRHALTLRSELRLAGPHLLRSKRKPKKIDLGIGYKELSYTG